MSKLVKVRLEETENGICVRHEADNPPKASYFVPRYIVIGTYDNGEERVVTGVYDLSTIKNGDIYLYDEFLHKIDSHTAKAFVLHLMTNGEHNTETEAKSAILSDMAKAGVTIDEEAMQYLQS